MADGALSQVFVGLGTAAPFVVVGVAWLTRQSRREGVIDTTLEEVAKDIIEIKDDAKEERKENQDAHKAIIEKNEEEHKAIRAHTTQQINTLSLRINGLVD